MKIFDEWHHFDELMLVAITASKREPDIYQIAAIRDLRKLTGWSIEKAIQFVKSIRGELFAEVCSIFKNPEIVTIDNEPGFSHAIRNSKTNQSFGIYPSMELAQESLACILDINFKWNKMAARRGPHRKRLQTKPRPKRTNFRIAMEFKDGYSIEDLMDRWDRTCDEIEDAIRFVLINRYLYDKYT